MYAYVDVHVTKKNNDNGNCCHNSGVCGNNYLIYWIFELKYSVVKYLYGEIFKNLIALNVLIFHNAYNFILAFNYSIMLCNKSFYTERYIIIKVKDRKKPLAIFNIVICLYKNMISIK